MAVAALSMALLASPAFAHHWARHWTRHWSGASFAAASPTDPSKDAALIIDGETGKVLYSRNADALRHPASLTKMMTLYLLFDQLKQGKITMSTMLPISQHAAEQHATNLHLWAGDSIPVETAIKAIVVRSANDVAVAIGEYIGGTESHFAELMTEKARELGMRSTFYHNASGLPDPMQITTASDLAILARHLGDDFPQYFHYFSTPSFYYRGTNYVTHDNLIGRYDGADGIKTGFTEMSGFNLVSSVVRDGAHIIGVVMGGRTAHLRDREMVSLLDGAFLQIAGNPNLVARNGVPWREVAQAASPSLPAVPASGGFTPAPSAPPSGSSTLAMLAPSPNFTAATDEDSAEAQTNEGNVDLGRTQVTPPPKPQAPLNLKPAPAAAPQVAQVVIPSIRPMRKPFANVAPVAQQPHAPIVIAAYAPKNMPIPKPKPKPGLREEIGEGDISYDRVATTVSPGDWSIQIGAFTDQAQARAQLASYAEKSMDVLGQAARVVAPFKAVDGQTMYRARFGPFAEREARDVCARLTSRGQTCFAAVTR